MTTDPRKLALALMAEGEQLDAEIGELIRDIPYDDLMRLWDRTLSLGDAADAAGNAMDLMIYSLATTMVRNEMQRRANAAAGLEVEGT